MTNNFAHVFLGLLVAPVLIVTMAIALAILIFEIVMFVDVIQNDHITSDRKLLWILGMFLLHPFVAIAYYFTDHKKKS